MSNANLSPARMRLAEHLESIPALGAEVARREAPVNRLKAELSRAAAELNELETYFGADHARSIAEAARSDDVLALQEAMAPGKSLLALETARRKKATIEAALAECGEEFGTAAAALAQKRAEMDSLLIAVLQEEHVAALARRERARQAYVDADIIALMLTKLFSEHGAPSIGSSLNFRSDWLRAGERAAEALSAALRAEPSVAQVEEARRRWAWMLSRLPTDVTARY